MEAEKLSAASRQCSGKTCKMADTSPCAAILCIWRHLEPEAVGTDRGPAFTPVWANHSTHTQLSIMTSRLQPPGGDPTFGFTSGSGHVVHLCFNLSRVQTRPSGGIKQSTFTQDSSVFPFSATLYFYSTTLQKNYFSFYSTTCIWKLHLLVSLFTYFMDTQYE